MFVVAGSSAGGFAESPNHAIKQGLEREAFKVKQAKASTSFLKKRSKKLLLTQGMGFGAGVAKCHVQEDRKFWFFFSKENGLLQLKRIML